MQIEAVELFEIRAFSHSYQDSAQSMFIHFPSLSVVTSTNFPLYCICVLV